ncbi:MAG TPA: DUF3857 domain-containing transglutaminase family protein [Sphingomicrobium sp.]
MRISGLALTCALAAFTASASSQAAPAAKAKQNATTALKQRSDEPSLSFGPVPAWVADQKIPPLDPKRKDEPFQFLLSNSQEYLTTTGLENFVEYVVEPLNQAGLQAIGNVAIPWNVNRTDLTLHRVVIERDGKSIDALNRDDVSVLRRETRLEQSTLTGIRTVVMPVRGLQVGDTLRVAFTYKTKPGVIGKTEEIQEMDSPVPFGRMVRRLVLSKDLSARWAIDPSIKSPVPAEIAAGVERVFVQDNFVPTKDRSFVPERLQHKLIQVSAFANWDEVAAVLMPLFDASKKTGDKSEIPALADKIAASHKDPRDRMLAALRMTQDQVRYVALLLGDGDYKPMKADDVWSQRFGDCKGKTVFLLALLDRLGIQAEPMLASVKYDDGLDQRLPTLSLLDHVFVRAHVGSEVYYLDGTNYGQRTLEELKQSPTEHGLPLLKGTGLVSTPDVLPSAPLIETQLVWDLRRALIEKVPFEATLVLRGTVAADLRLEAANSTDREKFLNKIKDKVNGVANDALKFVSSDADASDGSYVFHFNGTADLDWSPVNGLKGNRMQLSQTTVSWDPKFERDDDDAKNIPVSLSFPYWERTVEKVLLPEGGKAFQLDAPAIDETIAGTHIQRTVSIADGVVTSTSDFKRLKRELDAASARSAKAGLDKINSDYAYVVSKKKLKLSE